MAFYSDELFEQRLLQKSKEKLFPSKVSKKDKFFYCKNNKVVANGATVALVEEVNSLT